MFVCLFDRTNQEVLVRFKKLFHYYYVTYTLYIHNIMLRPKGTDYQQKNVHKMGEIIPFDRFYCVRCLSV